MNDLSTMQLYIFSYIFLFGAGAWYALFNGYSER